MKGVHEFRCIEEVLLEVGGNILNRNWNIIGNEVISPTIFDQVVLKVIDYGEVRSVDFLSGYPQHILSVGFGFGDVFLKLCVGRLLNGRIILEVGEELWLILHESWSILLQ